LPFLETLSQHTVRELESETLRRHAALAHNLSANAAWSSFEFQPVGFE